MFLLIGFTLMRVLVPGGRRLCRHDLWRALVGSGLGAGISSLAFVAALVSGVPALAIEAILLAVLAWFAWRGAECQLCQSPARPWDLLDRVFAVLFAIVTTCAAVLFLRQTIATPHGDWDGWAIHNLHARFLDHPAGWRDLFNPLLTWTHPDYPLLIPGFIASWWTLLGRESTVVPAATAFLFTFGAAGLLVSALTVLRDRRQGLLAGIVLLGTPSFISIGSGQMADVPLAWFLLASTALLVADYPAAAGLAAGFCGWTKNDGVMLFIAVVIAWGLARQWTFARMRAFGLGAIVPIAVLFWFKRTLATPNPLVSSANAVQHVLDYSRHLTILAGFLRHLWTFGGLFASAFIFLIAYVALIGLEREHVPRGRVGAVALTLMVAVCGDWAVYLFSTPNLVDLIDSSLDRLLVQLWPTVVFLAFLAAGGIGRANQGSRGSRGSQGS